MYYTYFRHKGSTIVYWMWPSCLGRQKQRAQSPFFFLFKLFPPLRSCRVHSSSSSSSFRHFAHVSQCFLREVLCFGVAFIGLWLNCSYWKLEQSKWTEQEEEEEEEQGVKDSWASCRASKEVQGIGKAVLTIRRRRSTSLRHRRSASARSSGSRRDPKQSLACPWSRLPPSASFGFWSWIAWRITCWWRRSLWRVRSVWSRRKIKTKRIGPRWTTWGDLPWAWAIWRK